ncbi:MAG: hypothetical protein ACN4GR_03715 [Arenicellales bacterium]
MSTMKPASFSDHNARDQRTINKYLDKYSEPESHWQAAQLAKLTVESWQHVVTIPACGEDEYLPGALESIACCQTAGEHARVLCIIVLNGNEAREAEFRRANDKMRAWFSEHGVPRITDLGPAYTCPQTLMTWRNIDILIIDRSQDPWLVPAEQGVGLVRKIGADLALFLIAAGKIDSPWIHTTDADARVPADYFLRSSELPSTPMAFPKPPSCLVYPYQHIPDMLMSQQEHDRYWPALTEYELWLRYYVAGLKWARSRYAYPSIGSLLACDALSYARIRGFPKRMAGEDFYFQNKLSKVGAMIMLEGEPVKLLTRPSSRVPFGTGQGTINIDKLNETGNVYQVYHPLVFDFLKGFLSAVQFWLEDADRDDDEKQQVFFSSIEKLLPASKQNKSDNRVWLQDLLTELQVFKNLCAAERRSKSIAGARQQFDDWFDGFRTLKLIHRLRDDLFGSLPLLDALQHSVFLQKPDVKAGKGNIKEAWLESVRTNYS